MNVVESLRAFQAVALEESFTRGAERCGVPQPVVSRRVAALERHLGVPLLDRTSRSVSVTEQGLRMLPHTSELLAQWELIKAAARSTTAPLTITLPPALEPRQLAAVRRGLGRLTVRLSEAGRVERSQTWQSGRADAGLLVAAPGPGTIDVTLGLGVDESTAGERGFSLARLRRSTRERDLPAKVVHLADEDDTPAVRDPLIRLAQAHGLRLDQVRVGLPRTEQLTRVFEHGDVIICSSGEATAAGLGWTPVQGLALVRSYQLVHRPGVLSAVEANQLRDRLQRAVGGTDE